MKDRRAKVLVATQLRSGEAWLSFAAGRLIAPLNDSAIPAAPSQYTNGRMRKAVEPVDIPSLEAAYQRLRPLLFRALATLARQGFPVLPADAQDLIHDFFAYAWNDIATGYDPAKGRLEAYVYAAFLQFSRPRIARLLRLQRGMLDPAVLTLVMDRRAAGSQPPIEIAAVRDAIDRLPEPQREVIDDYLQGIASSERALAKKYRLKRYQAKELLVEALGHLIVLLDRPPRIPAEDWAVAHALWKDGRTIAETAGYLQLPLDRVRAAAARNVRFLADLMQAYHALDHHARKGSYT